MLFNPSQQLKNHFYTLLVIKYQKKFRIYNFLIHISCSSLLLNNKKSFLHPPNNKISKEILYLYHILHSSLLSNNKKLFYTLLVIKYQKFHIYAFLIHISCSSLLNNKKSFLHPPNNKISKEILYLYHILHSSLLPNNKKSFLHPPSNKISKKFSYLNLLNSYLTLLTPSQQ